MPLYEYECLSCGCEFEELVGLKAADSVLCKKCGKTTKRKMSSFAPVVAGGTSVESVDKTIGREADKRWQNYTDKQSKRRKDKELKTVEVPKTGDRYMPVMGLGNKNEKEKRTEYVGALQEHRETRTKRGQSQFAESGSF